MNQWDGKYIFLVLFTYKWDENEKMHERINYKLIGNQLFWIMALFTQGKGF